MLTYTPEVKKTVHDYDFTFTSGFMMPVTVDLDAGDVITFETDIIRITLKEKPSLSDMARQLPAEEIMLTRSHIIAVQHRERVIHVMSPEEQFEWERTLNFASSGTIQ